MKGFNQNRRKLARCFNAVVNGMCLSVFFCSASNAPAEETPLADVAARFSNPKLKEIPSFAKHVVPVFNKAGCSTRKCHGSFQGQNGFQLSLFGYDLNLDHKELLEKDSEDKAPRINKEKADESLALFKAMDEVDHEGGERFEKGSWQYRVIHDWIAAGAPYDVKTEPYLEKLEVIPPEINYSELDKPVSLRVIAHFSDGAIEEVTSLTHFSSRNEGVALVNKKGVVSRSGTGDTHIVSSFAGGIATSQILIPRKEDAPFPQFIAHNPVDVFVEAKLKKLGIRPSGLCADEAFLRRAYLDTIATLPTPDEARQFLADKDPQKRARLVEDLLHRHEYALTWATIFSDWTGNNRLALNPNFKVNWLWHDWMVNKFSNNVPYDEFVEGIITATSREGKSLENYKKEVAHVWKNINPNDGRKNGFDDGTYGERKMLDLYWMKRGGGAESMAIRTSNTFLGIQIQCAQCHKHPFDRWTKNDFESFTSFFRVADVKALDGKPKGNRYDYQAVAVYPGILDEDRGNTKVGQVKKYPPKILGGEEVPYVKGGKDPRLKLYDWMVSSENPYFHRNIVNRIWNHYFGMGIVEPIDDFNAANPPSNPQLLDWLAEELRTNDFDLKHIHRLILNSRTYQLSHLPNDSNRNDRRNFSHAYVKRMQAETLIDALTDITGIPLQFSTTFAPPDTRALGVAGTGYIGSYTVSYAFDTFGKPKREQTCACERTVETGLTQALYLINDTDLVSKITDSNGNAARLDAEFENDADLIEELYLLALSRYPSPKEISTISAYMRDGDITRREAAQDALWSLLNVREFLFIK